MIFKKQQQSKHHTLSTAALCVKQEVAVQENKYRCTLMDHFPIYLTLSEERMYYPSPSIVYIETKWLMFSERVFSFIPP